MKKMLFIFSKIILILLLSYSSFNLISVFFYGPMVYNSVIPSFKIFIFVNVFAYTAMIMAHIFLLFKKKSDYKTKKLYLLFSFYLIFCLVIKLIIFYFNFEVLGIDFLLLFFSILLFLLKKEMR